MEVLNAMEFDRVTYDCSCRFCGVKVSAEMSDFVWKGDMTLAWECPICCMLNRETIIGLRRRKVVHYKTLEAPKGRA